jgi:thioredoxin 1
MKHWIRALIVVGLCAGATARADRRQVYSVTGVDCVECSSPIKAQLKKLKGVKKVEFDKHKVELSVAMDDHVSDDAILAAIARSGPDFKGVVGPGTGAYIPFAKYPEGADVVVLTGTGAAVGPLEKLRAPGKYTVFDLYADWCGPCRVVDNQLREIVEHRRDVAVRKLNIVDFTSALAREQGSKLNALPYLVVFSPSGKRTDITGSETKKLAAALGAR